MSLFVSWWLRIFLLNKLKLIFKKLKNIFAEIYIERDIFEMIARLTYQKSTLY